MAVEISSFGCLQDGRAVKRVTLKNECGTVVSVLTYGATIQAFQFMGKDIVLGYDRIEDYVNANGSYIGATIGRVANRIAGGRFVLGGQPVQVACNEPDRGCHLHGGIEGFDKKIWDFTVLQDGSEPSVCFDMVSEDGEENYPGRLTVSVTFTLNSENTLELAYRAETDKETVVNMTNHTYFNLNGCDGSNVLNTLLQVNADEFTPVDSMLIPTGEYASVEGTPLDLRQPHTIGEVALSPHPVVAGECGIDHNFVLAHDRHELSEAARAYSPDTGIRLVCYTDLPGIQIYTANFLCEEAGKYGRKWGRHNGFCLETQHFPDSVNHENFPSTVLRPGEVYTACTQFHVDNGSVE